MPCRDNIDKLIVTLEKTPIVTLTDQEEETIIDGYGNQVNFLYKHWNSFNWEIKPNLFRELYKEFLKELSSNLLIIDFNKEYYFSEAKTVLSELIKNFTSDMIGGSEFMIRKDVIIKYHSRDEDEIIEETDESGRVLRNSLRPKILFLARDRYVEIPFAILTEISNYFIFQERIVKKTLHIIDTYLHHTNKRAYGSSYKYRYFKFNYERIGKGEDQEGYIIAFIKELIDKGYISKESQQEFFDYFHNIGSSKRVIWLKSKEKLDYLIKLLINKKYIVDPIRCKSKCIAKIFIRKNGVEFSPEEFYRVHCPSDPSEIDSIVKGLG